MTNIKDVARASGVSSTTVSYVLNKGGNISPRTRARVQDAARQMGYHPSAVARGLLRGRMNTLGVVFSIPEDAPISNPYFAPILDGIAAAAARGHQNAMLFTGQIWSNAAHSLPVFCDGRCDGLLLVGPDMHSDIVPSLLTANVPFVLINNRSDDPRASFVDADDAHSGRTLARCLLAQGHTRVGFVCGDPSMGFVGRRLAAFCAEMKAGGAECQPEWIVSSSVFMPDAICASVRPLLALPPARRPTALVGVNDIAALLVVEVAQRAGLRVPQDLSVAGFDDLAPAAASVPPLTTIRQPLRLIGERAVQILMAQIAPDGPPGERALLPTELIVRGSVGPPAS